MKTTVLITLLLCSRLIVAQDYYDYYKSINKAKLSLIEDSLAKGVNDYYDTFNQFDFAFARDCFNALEVASKIGDLDKVDYFLRRCLKQGIEFDLLQHNSILTDFKKTEAWKKILLDKDDLRNAYESNVNWEIRNEVNIMFAEDQAIRDLAHKNRFNIFKIRKLNKQFEEIDRRLVLRILEITAEYGFPGEKLIGLDTRSMHSKIYADKLTAGMPIIILIHHYSQPNESYNPLLINEIAKGNLSNEHFATISDFQYKYGAGDHRESFCYSLMFDPKLDIEIIDKNRQSICLLSLSKTNELKRKKIITPKYYLY